MKYPLTLMALIFFISCNSNKEPSPEIKILSKKESQKIFDKYDTEKKRKKPKLKEKKKKEIIIKTIKGKTVKVGENTYKKINENLKRKEKLEKEKIKETLGNLEFLEYKKNVMESLEKDSHKGILNKKPDTGLIDKIRAVFKPVINKTYTLRNLNFKNRGNTILIDTITLTYRNDKKKIDLEIIPLNYEIAKYIKKGQKNFYFKSVKMDNIDIYFSINYKLKIINSTFNKLGYTWILNGINIDDYNDILDIIRNINFDTFMELKLKYEEE